VQFKYSQLINVPQKLKLMKCWVCWKAVWNDDKGKYDKKPINAKNGEYAKSNDPDTWCDFDTAVKYCKKANLNGIGFMFSEENGISGTDIDNCIDKNTGEVTDYAKEIIDELNSYTEYSPSKTGFHIITIGRLPPGGRKNSKLGLEMYENGRFFTITGDVIDNDHTEVEERSEALASVHAKYLVERTKNKKQQNSQHEKENVTLNINDDDIIEKAISAKNGDLFAKLMDGSWAGLYASQSEADIALCNMLAFWTGRDADAIDRIFRRSGLYRDKWDERRPGGSYGSITIDDAIANCEKVYQPKKDGQRKRKATEAPPEDPPDYDDGFEQFVKDQEDANKKKSFSLDDIGNAERLVARYGEDIRYCFPFKQWLIWDEICWKHDTKGRIFEMARQTARSIIDEAWEAEDSKRNDILKHVKKSCQSYALKAMIEQARSLPKIPVVPAEFDRNNWLLAAQNGTIDLKTGKLRPHDRNDLITKITPIVYDPDAKAPIWDAFLEKIFEGNNGLISFVQRAVGYSLTGDTSEQCFFMCHGTGSNGKSTLFNVLSDILGDYSRTANMELFSEGRNNQNSANEVAMLQGSRLVTTVETNDGIRLNEAMVKKLTGSDIITAKKLYADTFEYKPVFKIWIAVNHLPIIRGTDIGIWRRIRIIPFNVHISDAEKDTKLPEKLRNEYPGILRWAIEGCLQWQKQGLNPPDIVLAATQEYQEDQDIFADFINTCCVTGPGMKTRGEQLYHEYKKYCDESGYKSLTIKRFIRAMRDRGYEQQADRSRRYFWLGIGVAASDDMKDLFTDTYWQR
jgi:putative DNA primase/helicase